MTLHQILFHFSKIIKYEYSIQSIYHVQEENRILEKTNRQKVLEVEKLSQTIQELEEAVLAGGAAANAIRDYQRQAEELHVRFMGTYD